MLWFVLLLKYKIMLIVVLPIVFGIIGVIIGSLLEKNYWDDYKTPFFSLGVVMGLFLTFGLSTWTHVDYKRELTSKVDIVAIQDNIANKGRFFVGGGYVEGRLTYFFYKKQGKGFIGSKLDAEKATIIEDGGSYIEYFKKVPTKKWQDTWLLTESDEFQEIHVPKGSIIQNYSFDLRN